MLLGCQLDLAFLKPQELAVRVTSAVKIPDMERAPSPRLRDAERTMNFDAKDEWEFR